MERGRIGWFVSRHGEGTGRVLFAFTGGKINAKRAGTEFHRMAFSMAPEKISADLFRMTRWNNISGLTENPRGGEDAANVIYITGNTGGNQK